MSELPFKPNDFGTEYGDLTMFDAADLANAPFVCEKGGNHAVNAAAMMLNNPISVYIDDMVAKCSKCGHELILLAMRK